MSRVGDLAWSSKLQTPEGGFLWVRYNETVKEGWGVSMLHALHCLKMLRAEVRSGWEKEEAGKSRGDGMLRSSGEVEMRDEGKMHDGKPGDKVHLQHCLAYIAEVRCIKHIFEYLYYISSINNNPLIFSHCLGNSLSSVQQIAPSSRQSVKKTPLVNLQ